MTARIFYLLSVGKKRLIIINIYAKVKKNFWQVLKMEDVCSEATLSSSGNMTSFAFDRHVIRFRTSPHLERYTSVKEWDNGYIVCMAKYDNSEEPEEEYIDLVPILENLYFKPAEFLKRIKKVRVCYD